MSGPTPRPGTGSPTPMVVGGPGRPRPGSGPGSGPPHMAMMMPTAKPVRFKQSFGRLLRELVPERPLIVVVLLLGVVSVFLAILGPRLLGEATNVIFAGVVGKQLPADVTVQQAVDALNAAGQTNQAQMLASMPGVVPGQGIDFSVLARILSIAVGVYVFSSLFSWGQAYIMAGVTQRTVYRLRERVDLKLGRLPLAYFDRESRGDILSRVTNDIDNISQTLQQSLTQLITSTLTVIGVLIMMFTISPLLAFISLLAVPASMVTALLIARRSQVQFAAQWASTGTLNGHIEEMHTGHAIVKLFGRQQQAIDEFDRRNAELYEASYRAQFISGIIQPAMTFISNLNYVAICVIGGVQVATGQMTLGDVQAFIQYSRQFTMPIIQVASIANVIQSAVASAERVFELLDEAEEVPDPVTPPSCRSPRPGSHRGGSRSRTSRSATSRSGRSSRTSTSWWSPGRRWRSWGRPARQDDARQPADAVLRRRPRAGSRSTASRPGSSPGTPCAGRSGWSSRTRGCSRERSARTSCTGRMPGPCPRRRSAPRPTPRTWTTSCGRCPTGTTPSSTTTPPTCPRARSSC